LAKKGTVESDILSPIKGKGNQVVQRKEEWKCCRFFICERGERGLMQKRFGLGRGVTQENHEQRGSTAPSKYWGPRPQGSQRLGHYAATGRAEKTCEHQPEFNVSLGGVRQKFTNPEPKKG